MKNILILCAAVAVAGCATTTEVNEANVKIGELESRIARMEKDLYRVEVKSAPKVEPKFVPAKEVEQSVIDTKIDVFLKEYLGVAFGDPIEKYPQTVNDKSRLKGRFRVVTVKKKFQHFDKAVAEFYEGKLWSVSFFADIDNKYSVDSTNKRINQTLADLAVTFGLASNAFDGRFDERSFLRLSKQRAQEATTSYSLSQLHDIYSLHPAGFRRCGAVISNQNLYNKLQNEKNASGESLPEAK